MRIDSSPVSDFILRLLLTEVSDPLVLGHGHEGRKMMQGILLDLSCHKMACLKPFAIFGDTPSRPHQCNFLYEASAFPRPFEQDPF